MTIIIALNALRQTEPNRFLGYALFGLVILLFVSQFLSAKAALIMWRVVINIVLIFVYIFGLGILPTLIVLDYVGGGDSSFSIWVYIGLVIFFCVLFPTATIFIFSTVAKIKEIAATKHEQDGKK